VRRPLRRKTINTTSTTTTAATIPPKAPADSLVFAGLVVGDDAIEVGRLVGALVGAEVGDIYVGVIVYVTVKLTLRYSKSLQYRRSNCRGYMPNRCSQSTCIPL
jgi:hypothetical protein